MEESLFVERLTAMTPRLYRICRTFFQRESDCEDAVQSAILLAWQHQEALRREEAFEGWVIQILINECRKICRKSKRFLPLDPELPSAPGNENFWEIIHGLDEKYRISLELFYVEQFKIHEIARMLHLPEGTVKRRLHTARKKLKEGLS